GIWEMDDDGRKLHHLTAPNRADSVDRQVVTTRDGRYAVFQSDRSGSFEIWRVDADGSNLRPLTVGGNNTQATVSPDGRWIVYVSETDGRSRLRRISIDGGDSTALNDGPSVAPEVSPDGAYVAYFELPPSQPLRLAIMPFAGGVPVKTF